MKIRDADIAVDTECHMFQKVLVWNTSEVSSKKDVTNQAKADNRKVYFATMMDLRHLKHSELVEQLSNYKDSVVLRGDNVKDDTGGYAVFTEGASASHMTAAKVRDTISRFAG